MENIVVRKVTISGIKELQNISRQTFTETFSENNTKENLDRYIEESFTLEKLTEEINNPDSVFYFALENNKAIGYLKINTANTQTELKGENSLEIERIYVLKDYLGKKVGQLLYETAIQKALQLKVDFVWLGVWEENSRAINFYKKNGFIPFDKHLFKLGDDEQTDIMMKLVMDTGH